MSGSSAATGRLPRPPRSGRSRGGRWPAPRLRGEVAEQPGGEDELIVRQFAHSCVILYVGSLGTVEP